MFSIRPETQEFLEPRHSCIRRDDGCYKFRTGTGQLQAQFRQQFITWLGREFAH